MGHREGLSETVDSLEILSIFFNIIYPNCKNLNYSIDNEVVAKFKKLLKYSEYDI